VDRARLEKEIADLEKQVANLDKQFNDSEFAAKAPEKVIAGMRAKKAGYEAQIAKNRAAL
jgi:valyl-tRNA synthetase